MLRNPTRKKTENAQKSHEKNKKKGEKYTDIPRRNTEKCSVKSPLRGNGGFEMFKMFKMFKMLAGGVPGVPPPGEQKK